jgi:hypothetical protein
LIHNAVDERNRVQRVLQEANVQRLIRHSMRHLAFLEDEIAELDAEIVRQTEVGSLQPAMELVETIPGIKQTAAAALQHPRESATQTPFCGRYLRDSPYNLHLRNTADLAPNAATIAIVAKPPPTTLPTGPNQAAVQPDSTAPN